MADSQKFVQAQTFNLAGAGAVIGATSIILNSFQTIDGVNLLITDFGAKGYATIEPGGGANEEAITFTGVTQNANGTATLTGVSTQLFVSPYTETSGTAKTHTGGAKLIITNTAGFYNGLTSKSDDETITGTWTFTNPNYPRMDTATPAPTDNEQFATKKYVDDTAVSGAPNATTGVKGIIQLPTQAQAEAGTALGSTGASLVLTNAEYGARSYVGYAADAGVTDAYAITLAPVPTAYFTGMIVEFKAATANTGAATLNVNGLGAKNLFLGGIALITGIISANSFVVCQYDGTQFNILSVSDGTAAAATAGKIAQRNSTGDVTVNSTPTAGTDAASKTYVDASAPAFKTGNTTHDMTSTTTTTIAHGLGKTPKFIRMSLNSSVGSGGNVSSTVVNSTGTYDGTTQNCLYHAYSSNGSLSGSDMDTTHIIRWSVSAAGSAISDFLLGTATFDATNITITWAKTNSPTGTANIIWEAYA